MSLAMKKAPGPAIPGRKLSKHFSLKEMTVTQTGLSNSIDDQAIIRRLELVCQNVLEKVREHYQRPIIVHSGYRSPLVNKAVGGAATSQHVRGEAVDFHVMGNSLYDVAIWISGNIDYDQLILENYLGDQHANGWVHCSYGPRMRYDNLTKFKGSKKYHQGILKSAVG
ncbi:D-Ala-D-Ala carboxypeptidase family metallohydrolase [Methylobacterium sp. 37f]|uniref:D-Ala-D-Ala carboxypeptidase family metallohydrolase n=1 Tax=Methylobacterium sp. 37f TaxID=2817058 RepID=UPI001FFD52E4|nr:D-Ala-D-Ala carboxypeptidase family metallohydrolase [Methylobacterium sp. 37f]MCK2056113.1 DUF882 domain-containing protein [Methylobacterium sp. 37f]